MGLLGGIFIVLVAILVVVALLLGFIIYNRISGRSRVAVSQQSATTIQTESRRLPMIISLILSLTVLTVLFFFKEHPTRDYVLRGVLWASFISVLVFTLIFTISRFIQRLRQFVWISTIPYAMIVYFGILIISLSYYKDVLAKMNWDPSMLGLGIAVLAFGWVLFTQRQQ